MNSNVGGFGRKNISLFLPVIFALIFSFTVKGAGEVDTSFTASLTIPGTGYAEKIFGQPDGKFLVSGYLPNINGVPTNNLVRFYADGRVDDTFKAPVFTRSGGESAWIRRLAVQSDGKVLVAGGFTRVNGADSYALIRLNSDGSLDTSFPNVFPSGSSPSIYKIHVLPDDSFLVAGAFTVNSPNGARSNFVKFSRNGIVDTSFNYTNEAVQNFVVQPDGKIVIAWTFAAFNSSRVTRLNSDGSIDPTFAQISLTDYSGTTALVYLSGGKILIGGDFTMVNGVSRTALFRANPDGTIDTTFTVSNLSATLAIAVDPGGKYYVAGTFNSGNSVLYRLNSDGTRDTSFGFSSGSNFVIDIYLQAGGNLIAGLIYGTSEPIIRITSGGGRDSGFKAAVSATGKGLAVFVQPDNKILVGGKFTAVNGLSRYGLTRFNSNGTLDTGFGPALGFSSEIQIYDIAMQPDGKILITTEGGDARRLNPNGSLDITFPDTRSYWDVESLPDGKVLLGGASLRRFNANGTLDAMLGSVGGATAYPSILGMAVQPDGKIIIVGNFLTVGGAARNRIARMNPDGTFDGSFSASVGTNADIYTVALQPDGKILIGGAFTSVNSDTNKKFLARLNSDGSLDTSFTSTTDGPILDIKLQSNGKILLGGSMSAVNGAARRGIAKLNADGSLDASFNAGTGTNSTVWGIGQQSDGKIVYVGEFYRTNGIETLGIGRLFNAPQSKLFDFDGDNRSDIGVFRPGSNTWYQLLGANYQFSAINFGTSGDILAPADYDGDGKTDLGIFRPSTGTFWYAASSANNAFRAVQWGQVGDVPLPSDFDGDGKSDYVVYRPSNSTWYRLSATGISSQLNFGLSGDKPLIGDFDGDGKTDHAIYRPSTGVWWYAASSANNAFRAIQWGTAEDIPVAADFDGDGKTDTAVFKPANGVWYILNSGNQTATVMNFGLSGDKPAAADYDGDGKADIAVYRPSNGGWYIMRSTAGFLALEFGINGDTAIPNAFVP